MNRDKNIICYLTLVAAFLLLYLGYSMINQFTPPLKSKSSVGELPILESNNSELIEQALAYKAIDSSFTYTGDFPNPFRSFNQTQVKNGFNNKALPPAPQRPQLYLKGILIKEKPLAILEDQRGETYIRGIGELVLDQKIIGISGNLVKLRDLRGTYELSVENE